MIIIQDKKYWIGLFLACLFLLVLAPISVSLDIENYAEDFIFQQDNTINIKSICLNNSVYCPSNIECNLTIVKPDLSIFIDNQNMTYQNSYYNYTLTNSNTSGNYKVLTVCEGGVNTTGFKISDFKITYHGKDSPSDFVKVFFIISFVAILILMIITIFLLVKHMEKYDVGFMDVIYMFSIYLAVYSLKYFNMEYMGSYLIDTFSDLFITVGAFTHIIIPIIIFVVCFMKRRLELKEEEF